ncbi:AI-2E family transporter [Amphibacillus marinus]
MSDVSNNHQPDNNQQLRYQKWYRIGFLTIIVLVVIYLIMLIFPNYREVLSSLGRIILPFLLAGLCAYLLMPVVNLLISWSIPKWLAILVIFLLIALLISGLAYYSYPKFIEQAERLTEQFPELLSGYRNWLSQIEHMVGTFPEPIHSEIDKLFNRIDQYSANWLEARITGMTKLTEYLISLAVVPVLLYYLLLDFNKLKQRTMQAVPRSQQKKVKQMIRSIDHDLGHYIRGQLLICLFVGLTTYIVYLIIRLDYSILLALFMGVMNIIPYFGPLIGAFPALLIALTISTETVVFLIIGMVAVQFLEGNILAPLILGHSVHVHPILVILVLLIGGELAGILGMVLAVPIVVVLRSVLLYNPFKK